MDERVSRSAERDIAGQLFESDTPQLGYALEIALVGRCDAGQDGGTGLRMGGQQILDQFVPAPRRQGERVHGIFR